MNQLVKLGIACGITLMTVVGCGKDSQSNSNGSSGSFRYNYTVNGCSTGDKSARNHDEYCKLLLDDNQNRDAKTGEVCASDIRAQMLEERCPEYVKKDEYTQQKGDFFGSENLARVEGSCANMGSLAFNALFFVSGSDKEGWLIYTIRLNSNGIAEIDQMESKPNSKLEKRKYQLVWRQIKNWVVVSGLGDITTQKHFKNGAFWYSSIYLKDDQDRTLEGAYMKVSAPGCLTNEEYCKKQLDAGMTPEPTPAVTPSAPVTTAEPSVPTPTATPAIYPQPGVPISTPIPAKNIRCSLNSTSVTVDGKNAFSFYSDDDRMNAYQTLLKSGFCNETSKLGANTTSITFDGRNAVSFYNESERMNQLIRFYQSGFGSTSNVRCGITTTGITIDGNVVYSIYSEEARMKKAIELYRSGMCY